MWSPHTAIDINKLESVQRRAARWVTRDYRYISSLKDLNWHPLDQQCIDSWLVLMCKVTYDLLSFSIPASNYIVHKTRQSRHNYLLAYRQIPTEELLQIHIPPMNHYSLEYPTSLHTVLPRSEMLLVTHQNDNHTPGPGLLVHYPPRYSSVWLSVRWTTHPRKRPVFCFYLSTIYTNILYRTVPTRFILRSSHIILCFYFH